jgi:hypothetical protein
MGSRVAITKLCLCGSRATPRVGRLNHSSTMGRKRAIRISAGLR